nr:hypothetical protein [Acholeplasmatales bacterium]
DKMSIILDVINEFRKYDKYVNVFYNDDNSFYKAYDEVFTFKLPIKIIQPSKFFINKDRLECIEKYLENEEIYIPVTIINDEYVIIDGHTRLLAKYNEDFKMVNVYMDKSDPIIDDLVYMAKENNINHINKCEVISNDDYNTYWNSFLTSISE